MRSVRSQGMMVTVNGTSVKNGVILAIIGFMLMFSISGIMTSLRPEYRISSSSINNLATNLSGEALVYLLGYENRYFTQSLPETSKAPNYLPIVFEAATTINPDDPRSLLGGELPGFSLFDGEIIVAGEGTNYTNMPFESAPPLEVLKSEREAAIQNLEKVDKSKEDKPVVPPVMTTNGKKVVYLYATHSRESFLPYLKGVTDPNLAHHSEVNITNVVEKLGDELVKRGIGTEISTNDFVSDLVEKGLNYSAAYNVSRPVVQNAMVNNRDLQYFIDVHRDSQRKDVTTVTINGKEYAKTIFIIGKNNAMYEQNLQLVEELHNLLEKKYPGLSRGITTKQGEGTNGKFNQDLSKNAILIEFGGVDNTFEELNRTAAAIADVFSEYYWQAEKVSAQSNSEKQ